MHLTRTIKIQIIAFIIVAIVSLIITAITYLRLPAMLFGVGRYSVTVELPKSGNLYANANVTYRGTEVGEVKAVRLTDTGVVAVLSMDSNVHIPSDLDAQVHSQTAIGEQYVALLPRNATSPPLKDGDVIPLSRTSVPPDINSLLDATNRGLGAIPNDNVKTVIDESYTAFGGLGPEFSRFVDGATTLAIDAQKNIDSLTTLIDDSKPVFDSQTDSADSVQAWAAHLATITGELQSQDAAVAGLLEKGGPAADEVRALLDRVRPTLPVLLANLVSVGQVAVTYQADIEQLLVLLPQGVANVQGTVVPNRNTKQPYTGGFLSFNTGNLNLPPPCTTGFLPAQQRRVPSLQDWPDRPAGDLYCRRPQDSMWNVRGARNIPCETVPGKRAPTVKMCESDEQYVPLNDGLNWKGDPNATLSGQGVPQLPPGSPAAPQSAAPASAATSPPPLPALATAEYDPATGTYVGPDGNIYTQKNLAQTAKEQTWQSMLIPPG
jgi:phospholipid/cholesterol/gamma-HCH transport system substrate-binding protein